MANGRTPIPIVEEVAKTNPHVAHVLKEGLKNKDTTVDILQCMVAVLAGHVSVLQGEIKDLKKRQRIDK